MWPTHTGEGNLFYLVPSNVDLIQKHFHRLTPNNVWPSLWLTTLWLTLKHNINYYRGQAPETGEVFAPYSSLTKGHPLLYSPRLWVPDSWNTSPNSLLKAWLENQGIYILHLQEWVSEKTAWSMARKWRHWVTSYPCLVSNWEGMESGGQRPSERGSSGRWET